MSDTVEHKTFKQALLEFYQARGIPSSDIKFSSICEGSPHCPNFGCTLRIPRVPSTHFVGQDLYGEGKSKKAAEHAAAAAALDHLRDVGLLKVPAPAVQPAAPIPPPTQTPYGAPRYGSPSLGMAAAAHHHRRLQPAVQNRGNQMQVQRSNIVEASEDVPNTPSSTGGSSVHNASVSSLSSGYSRPSSSQQAPLIKREVDERATGSQPVAAQALLPSASIPEEEITKGATEPFCLNPQQLPQGEANRQLEAANERIMSLCSLILEERKERALEAGVERERRKFAAEVLLGVKDGNKTFLESDAVKGLETKMGQLKRPSG